MKKILIVSTVSRQFYLFEQGNIEVLKSLGYEVHGAANFSDKNERLKSLDIVHHHFDIQRSPFSFKNIIAYRQLKKIMKTGEFDAVHCHSPMGGVLGRLVAKSVGISSILYTAHGFHFYKGAPLINWLVYYPVERFLARYTDTLITINNEDYKIAKKFRAKKIVHIPGIGVETGKFNKVERKNKRIELGIEEDTVVLLSIGEMIKRKNHETAIKAISRLENQNFIYLICGKGELEDNLKELVKSLNIKDKVRFLGFRSDIPELCSASDIFLFPSYQEGLPVSMMEAMASGLPIIASKIRGNIDLIQNNIGGYLQKVNDVEQFANSIETLINNSELRKDMSTRNIEEVKKYDKAVIKANMIKIYEQV